MKRQFGWALAATVLLGGVGTAFAADMPLKAPPPAVLHDWTGWYVGVDVGGAWARDPFNHSPFASTTGTIVADPSDLAATTAAASPTLKGSGVTGGLYAGYNWQRNRFVVGLEADGSVMNIGSNSSGTFAFPSTLPGGAFGPPTVTFSALNSFHVDWQATFRGRAGLVVNDWLFYGTGGLAVAGIRESQNVATGGSTLSQFSSSDTRAGWVAGGGIERLLWKNWILRVEYLHADYGNANHSTLFAVPAGTLTNTSCTAGTPGFIAPAGGFATTAGCSISSHVTTDVARIGLAYKF
jgi:outer membrane immunogenic protein